jgi:hypothetical protein
MGWLINAIHAPHIGMASRAHRAAELKPSGYADMKNVHTQCASWAQIRCTLKRVRIPFDTSALKLRCASQFCGDVDLSYLECVTVRRRADNFRVAGWLNAALTFILSVGVASDTLTIYGVGAVWAAFVMAITHSAAYLVEQRAQRTVTA